jgi:cytidine deaminase
MKSETPESVLAELIQRALATRQRAYAPYSNFKVGAALLTEEGKIFTGCNVENASFGLCICAERSAICQAIATGERKFRAMVVAATPLASPCGACRQFISEFGADIPIFCIDADDPTRRLSHSSGELLPMAFAGNVLPGPARKLDDDPDKRSRQSG